MGNLRRARTYQADGTRDYLRAVVSFERPTVDAGPVSTTEETVDGMSLKKIFEIIELLKQEQFHWTAVRRTYIPKKNRKSRPLGLPTWTDKLVQEVLRSLLEAYYEPQFSEASHGFRPQRGCHTALSEIRAGWRGIHWFIEGDIKACFDQLNHSVLLDILAEKIHDNRFLRLIKQLLQAGYLEEWRYHATSSGSPQGVWFHQYWPISTWISWITTVRRNCSPPTRRENVETSISHTTVFKIESSLSKRKGNTHKRSRSNASFVHSLPEIRTILTSDDSSTCVMPMTRSLARRSQNRKQRRSKGP
jgi:retron-type reverse transcriptase